MFRRSCDIVMIVGNFKLYNALQYFRCLIGKSVVVYLTPS